MEVVAVDSRWVVVEELRQEHQVVETAVVGLQPPRSTAGSIGRKPHTHLNIISKSKLDMSSLAYRRLHKGLHLRKLRSTVRTEQHNR
jgi:hypothetical protein